MFSARWAHRTLVGICILLAVGVALYAGWEGWLGKPIQGAIRDALDPLSGRIPNHEFLDRLARVLGAVGTALTAAFGVYKGIYYADRNLPERLKQLLGRADERLKRSREPLLTAVTEARAGSRVAGSVFYVFPLNRALAQLGYRDLSAADSSLKEALRELEGQVDVSVSQKRNLEEQKVAAHILRGSIASARAELNAQQRSLPDDDREAAEKEFDRALTLRPADLDALELRGRQREVRGNFVGALEDYEPLAAAAEQANDAFRTARGFRLQGELVERHATKQTALMDAGKRLDAALKSISTIGSLKNNHQFEKGLPSKKRKPSARVHLENAARCFDKLRTPEAMGHANEVAQMLRELDPPPEADHGAPAQSEAVERAWYRRWFG